MINLLPFQSTLLPLFLSVDSSSDFISSNIIKEKNLIEQICNVLLQGQIIARRIIENPQEGVQRWIWMNAKSSWARIMAMKMHQFEDKFITQHIKHADILNKVDNALEMHLSKIVSSKQQYLGDSSSFYLLELLQIAHNLVKSISAQHTLIIKEWQICSAALDSQIKPISRLRELALHIGFQTEIDPNQVNIWKDKMINWKNRRSQVNHR